MIVAIQGVIYVFIEGTMVNLYMGELAPFTLGLDETLNRLETFAGTGTNYPPFTTSIMDLILEPYWKSHLQDFLKRNFL